MDYGLDPDLKYVEFNLSQFLSIWSSVPTNLCSTQATTFQPVSSKYFTLKSWSADALQSSS